MDKTLVNHQIVTMRPVVRKAIRQVTQKHCKNVTKLQSKLDKNKVEGDGDDEAKKRYQKWQRKLASKKAETDLLKKLTLDDVSKQALALSPKQFNDSLLHANTSLNDRLIALVAITKTVQAAVNKFKQDNPGADQWLPVLLDLWQEKKQTFNKKIEKIAKKKRKMLLKKIGAQRFEEATKMTSDNLTKPSKSSKTSNGAEIQKEKINGNKVSTTGDDLPQAAVIKRIDLNSVKSKNILEDETSKPIKKEPMKRLIVDDFFLGEGQTPPPQSSEKQSDDEIADFKPKKNNFAPKINNPRRSIGKLNQPNNFNPKAKPDQMTASSSEHPSWQAKKVAKETQKLDFDQLPKVNKKIKF